VYFIKIALLLTTNISFLNIYSLNRVLPLGSLVLVFNCDCSRSQAFLSEMKQVE